MRREQILARIKLCEPVNAFGKTWINAIVVKTLVDNIALCTESIDGYTMSYCMYYKNGSYRLGMLYTPDRWDFLEFNPTEMSIRLRSLLNRYPVFKGKVDEICDTYINICMEANQKSL